MTFFLFFIIIIVAVVIIRFNNFRNQENAKGYYEIPAEVRSMIDNEEAIELAEVLTQLEMDNRILLADKILKAIDYKGFSFARRVDKVRDEMRRKAGLGRLK